MDDKVYCENCVHIDNNNLCQAPTDNWYSPKGQCNHPCNCRNKNNNCKDFKEKERK